MWTGTTAGGRSAAQRTLADIRWLDAAFDRAEEGRQSRGDWYAGDMWDPAALLPAATDSANTRSSSTSWHNALSVGGPVLLINGELDVFGTDQPLADPKQRDGVIHGAQAVPNLTRITVQGLNQRALGMVATYRRSSFATGFQWENVVYCKTADQLSVTFPMRDSGGGS